MSTAAQLDANRANAQQSTGPRTEEGKQRAALNSVTHGFTGQTLMLTTALEKEAYAILNGSMTVSYGPVGPLEIVLVRRIIDNQFRVIQIQTTEAGIYALGHREYSPDFGDCEPEDAAALARVLTFRNHRAEFDRLHRYERNLMRQVEKDKLELEQLQNARRAQVEEAAALAEHYESKGEPFDPSQFGFVLSTVEIASFRDGRRILENIRKSRRPSEDDAAANW